LDQEGTWNREEAKSLKRNLRTTLVSSCGQRQARGLSAGHPEKTAHARAMAFLPCPGLGDGRYASGGAWMAGRFF